MANFDKAKFNFKIKPEDSKFLKSWNQLRNDGNFQQELARIKAEVSLEKSESSFVLHTLFKSVLELSKSSSTLFSSDLFSEPHNKMKINLVESKTEFYGSDYKVFRNLKRKNKTNDDIFKRIEFSQIETTVSEYNSSKESYPSFQDDNSKNVTSGESFMENSYAF